MSRSYPSGKADSLRILTDARAAYRGGDWTSIATGMLDGPPVEPLEGLQWLAKECVERTVDEWDSVLAITGKEGVSKSTAALRLGLYVEKISGVPWTFDNLCYSAREVLRRYETAQRSSVIWLDEGARGLWAGDDQSPETKALAKALTLIRETGAILVVCSPDIWLLTKKFRGRRAAFWAHVDSRGTRRAPADSHARLFERDDRLHFEPTDNIGMSPSLRCPSLTYPPFATDDSIYLEYRRIKKSKLHEFYVETNAELDEAQRRSRGERRTKREFKSRDEASGIDP
jgi:hypothetical protein